MEYHSKASAALLKKKCIKCMQMLSLSSYYKNSKSADGFSGKCKECAKQFARANREGKLDYYREFDRERFQTPERKAAHAIASQKHYAKYPEKRAARVWVNNAIRDGRLLRQPCEVCGATSPIQAHHDDYSKFDVVRWLCTEHHHAFHNQHGD